MVVDDETETETGAGASNAPFEAPKGEVAALLGRASNGLGAGASNAP